MKQHKKGLIVWLAVVAALLALCLIVGPSGAHEDV